MYSDNCVGQNKNHALSRLFLALTDNKRFEKIEQFFPIRGHSFLPCDRDFGIIKKELKKHDRIYSIHELTNLIIRSTKSQKFTVKEVQSEEILEFKNWWPKFYKRKCISEESKTRNVPLNQKVCFMISSLMHYSYDSRFRSRIVGRNFIDSLVSHTFCLKTPGTQAIVLPDKVAYPLEKVPIKFAKLNDIRKLLPYIPHDHSEFFNQILDWPTTEDLSLIHI